MPVRVEAKDNSREFHEAIYNVVMQQRPSVDPQNKNGITRKDIFAVLEKDDWFRESSAPESAQRKKLERALNKMQSAYDDQPLVVYEGSPNRYKAIDGFEFPTEQVDSPTALTLLMAKDLLHHSLPSVCHKQLNNHLGDIEDRLKKSSKSEYLNWKAKVALYPEGYSNRMGNIETIDNDIFVKITEALFSDKRIKALYVNRADEESEREMDPLGLVNRGNIIYLLVTFWKGSQVVPLPLSRFISLDILDKPLLKPDNFSLHDLLKNGGIFNVHKGEIEEIQLSISDFLLVHFKERPPGLDFQILSIDDNNKNIVSFNEVISDEFIWWLRAMGPNVKVLQPQNLIDTLKKDLEKTLAQY